MDRPGTGMAGPFLLPSITWHLCKSHKVTGRQVSLTHTSPEVSPYIQQGARGHVAAELQKHLHPSYGYRHSVCFILLPD